VDSTSMPSGVTAPSPVITTRRFSVALTVTFPGRRRPAAPRP
jgi:hypothetical protein